MTEDELMAASTPAAPNPMDAQIAAWKKMFPYLGAGGAATGHAPTLGDYEDASRKFSNAYNQANPFTGAKSNITSSDAWVSGNDAAAQNAVQSEQDWNKRYGDIDQLYRKQLTPEQYDQWQQMKHEKYLSDTKKMKMAFAAAAGGMALGGLGGLGAVGDSAGTGALGGSGSAMGTGSGVLGAVDSAAASAAGGFSGLGASSIPSAVNLGSLGGIMETGAGALGGGVGGGIPELPWGNLPGINQGASLGGGVPSWETITGGGLGAGSALGGGGSFLDAIKKIPGLDKILGGGTAPSPSGGRSLDWSKLLGGAGLGAAGLAAIQALRNNQKMPDVPDYFKLAQQTADSANQAVEAQTLANRPNQTNAFGDSSNWSKGANGQWNQSVNLSAANQKRMQEQQAMMAALRGQISNQQQSPMAMPAMQGMPTNLTNVDLNALTKNLPAMGGM